MKIKEVKVKTCMTKSKITDYVINPYVGCLNSCCYCYAVFMKRFMNITDEWGDFCHAKINCPELLEEELKKNLGGHVWLSSVTDCYNPAEKKYKLTRKILEIILRSPYKNKFTFEILTKSSLVRRDFDLLKKLNIDLGMTVNTFNKKASRIIEPYASPPDERVRVLEEAGRLGIKVHGFISPVLPFTNLEELFKKLVQMDKELQQKVVTRKVKPAPPSKVAEPVEKRMPEISELELKKKEREFGF